MRFLVAVDKAEYGTTAAVSDDVPAAGEPVVPWFPAPPENVFLSCTSFKKTPYAQVADIEADPDVMLKSLTAQYPGLPEKLHRAYIFKTAIAVSGMPPGTKFRVMISSDSAAIQQVNDETNIITLWEKQPIGDGHG